MTDTIPSKLQGKILRNWDKWTDEDKTVKFGKIKSDFNLLWFDCVKLGYELFGKDRFTNTINSLDHKLDQNNSYEYLKTFKINFDMYSEGFIEKLEGAFATFCLAILRISNQAKTIPKEIPKDIGDWLNTLDEIINYMWNHLAEHANEKAVKIFKILSENLVEKDALEILVDI